MSLSTNILLENKHKVIKTVNRLFHISLVGYAVQTSIYGTIALAKPSLALSNFKMKYD